MSIEQEELSSTEYFRRATKRMLGGEGDGVKSTEDVSTGDLKDKEEVANTVTGEKKDEAVTDLGNDKVDVSSVIVDAEKVVADKEVVAVEKFDVKEAYSKWADENESSLASYFTEKSRDYKSMSPDVILLQKMAEENPGLSGDEISLLFEDTYGESASKIVIDKDEMDADEIKEAEAFNKEIDKRFRKMSAEAKKVASEFEKRKESLERPVFSAEVEASTDGEERYTVDEFSSLSEKEQADAVKEWSDFVEAGVKPLEKFEYRDLSLDLSEEDNTAIKDAVLNYVAQPGDVDRFSDGKNGVDLGKLTSHVAKSVLLDKLLDAAKDAKKKEINEKAVNPGSIVNEAVSNGEISSQTRDANAWARLSGR